MTHTLAFFVVAVNAYCSCVAYGETYGQLTVTENLIRQEIVRLGGDWESGEKPALVSFLGDNFESKHFEMLKHLPTIRYFHVENCLIDHMALAYLSQVHQLERIDIQRCKLKSECLSLLRSNRELREIHFESVMLSENVFEEIARLEQIKKLVFIDCEGVTDERLSTLEAALPNLVVVR